MAEGQLSELVHSISEDCCVICKCGFEDKPISVSKRAILTLIKYSEKHGKLELTRYLNECISMDPIRTVLVHSICRRDFTNPNRVYKSNENDIRMPCSKKLRSDWLPFNWKEDCFLCGISAMGDRRHPERAQVHKVTTLPFRDNLLEHCGKRGDVWGIEVQNRLNGCIDLVAAEAVYHHSCLVRFMLIKDQNKASTVRKPQGRPEDQGMLQCFQMLCQWLESEADADLYTLAELHAKMKEFQAESEVYTVKRLKQKLQEHYKEFIFFADIGGRNNVVCFRNTAKYILNEKWYADRNEDIEKETERIVTAAAKIIRAEIREQKYDSDSYPTNEDIADVDQGKKWVPHHLQIFLRHIIPSPLKQNSIGHSLIQAARPRSVITPTLFGLGVEMDHVFGSKWLINELSRLGFSISYDEVNRYKQSVIQSESVENILEEYCPNTFTQWVADNVDHNVVTLDGQGTFHGMGIIAVSTSKLNTSNISKSRVISRQQRINVNELVKGRGINIAQYTGPPEKGLASISYKSILQLQVPYTLPVELSSDLLWHSGGMFSSVDHPRPNWSGFMQNISSDNEHSTPKSEVLLLPIIDLNPSDDTCIYSTLLYIESQAKQLNIPTPCITFDQPLWIKAVEIIKAKGMHIVCRLGGFHTLMSFMGSIGAMMKGSGLEEALEVAYGPNAVIHMISGKAFSRALRGHFLVEAALMNKLIMAIAPCGKNTVESLDPNETYDISREVSEPDCDKDETSLSHAQDMEYSSIGMETVPLHTEEMDTDNGEDIVGTLDATEVSMICDLYERVRDKSIPVASVADSKDLLKLEECLFKLKTLLAERSPTAKLWLQYIDYVEIVKQFIRAERTGDWSLHLVAIGKMLNLFAATGHINYAKSSRLYLQLMQELPNDHPWLHKCFMEEGFHTVRRSSRYWAGLWTDLTIEQVMMRSLKSRGGLTRGRGVTETVRLEWVHSMHKCAGVHDAMTTMTGLKHKTSEQHVELGKSRIQRDFTDLNKIQDWFNQHDPFDLHEQKLRSLSSGLTANDGDGINCDKTEEVGANIQKRLDNVSITEASIKRSEQIRSLDHLKPGIVVDNRKALTNPNLLFSCLIAIVQRQEDMMTYFEYELTTIPTSLFKDSAMRKPVKASLAKALTTNVVLSEQNKQAMHVLDGGALLHRIKWVKKNTYQAIAKQYVTYVTVKYGQSCIVFDGYGQGPSIKDHEHQRRAGKTCADIHLHESMVAHNNQEIFLSNERNKSQFILLLNHYLKDAGHIVHNSTGDADTLIVSCALQFAKQGNEVNVVADDTDILILLMYHWNPTMANIYFQSEARKSQKTNMMVWNISDLVRKADKLVTSNLLFIHAWGGCDTTSATFGQGKISLLKRMKESPKLQEISSLMSDPDATVEQIGQAGVQLFVILYDGKEGDTLTSLRYARFMEMVSSSKIIDAQKLPPTARAAYFHSLRVHLQVILWRKLTNNALEPKQWGWEMNGTILTPILTDLDAAPESLLKFIRCKCKLSSKNPCGSNLCSCRKNGLKCVTACGDCRGENCKNSEEVTVDLDIEEENFGVEAGNIY